MLFFLHDNPYFAHIIQNFCLVVHQTKLSDGGTRLVSMQVEVEVDVDVKDPSTEVSRDLAVQVQLHSNLLK